jgi:mRNA interferase RelE/StbE
MKTWKVLTSKNFDKQIKTLDRETQQLILAFLKKRVIIAENPRILAKPLSGSLRGYLRFRVGDYRIIADIQEEILTVVALDLGHRKELYN